MALQHSRAAQQHATTTDYLGRSILVTIAMDIGHNNQDAFPSYRTIADRVGCHYNSVQTWVKRLEECGDLIVRKDGKRQYYNIPFTQQLSQPDYDNSYDNNCHNDYDNSYDNVMKIVTSLSQEVEKLSQQVSQIVTTMAMTEERSIKKEEEEYIYMAPDPEPIAKIKTSISQVSKTALTAKTNKDYDEAAYFLFGHDATREQIAGFGEWWLVNGYYPGKPALKSLVDEWVNYRDGVTIFRNGNGKDETAAPLYVANEEGLY